MKEKMGTSRKHGGNPILKKRRAVEFIRDNKMENKEKKNQEIQVTAELPEKSISNVDPIWKLLESIKGIASTIQRLKTGKKNSIGSLRA
jgi:hypothetical protein